MKYFPNVCYNGIICELVYVDPSSYYYNGREGWILIADLKKSYSEKISQLGFEYKKECYLLEITDEAAIFLASRTDTEQRKTDKTVKLLAVPIIYFFCLLFLWQMPICIRLNMIKLPEDAEQILPAKAEISDVYIGHIHAEKVFKCSGGSEYAKKYIKEHNPVFLTHDIEIWDFLTEWDDLVYYPKQRYYDSRDKDRYVRLRYYKRFDEMYFINLVSLLMIIWFWAAAAKLIKTSFKNKY